MKAYHFFDVERFDLGLSVGETLETPQAQVLGGVENDKEPETSVTFVTNNFMGQFQHYSFMHEWKTRNKTVRAYGREDYWDNPIMTKSFDGYYHPDHQVLILQTSKQVARAAVRRLSRAYPERLEASVGSVDFPFIVERAANVTGSWIGNLPYGNVTSVGLFGDHVNLSTEYTNHMRAGELKALYVELIVEGDMKRFMITKDRAVVIYEDQSIVDDLRLLMAVRPLLYAED